MSSRHRRTRIYGANYDIGESYYKKQLNDLDNKAGSYRNSNGTVGVDPLNENKLIPKVSFLCSDSDYDDNASSRLMGRNKFLSSFEDADHKSYEKAITDLKHYDDFEDQFVKGASKLKVTELPLENGSIRNDSTDVLNRSYMKYSFEKEETPLRFAKKPDTIVSVRSKYVLAKEKDDDDFESSHRVRSKYVLAKEKADDDFEASHRVNATKARLHDLEEEMSTIAKKQTEREKRNLNLKKILSSTSRNEYIEN